MSISKLQLDLIMLHAKSAAQVQVGYYLVKAGLITEDAQRRAEDILKGVEASLQKAFSS